MHSQETKFKAIIHYENFLHSYRKVSKIYNVSKSSLHRWVSGRQNKQQKKHIRKSKEILQSIKHCVETLLKKNPFLTIQSVCKEIAQCCKVRYSTRKVSRIVSKLGYTKKKAFNVIDYTPPPERVLDFCNTYLGFQDNDLICIDEAGFYVGDHGRRGYAPCGKRLHVSSGRSLRKSKFTLIMAVTTAGVLHYEVLVDSNCRKNDFLNFIDNLPSTSTPKAIVMDNIRFHHSKETMKSLSSKGYTVIFTPPYSPAFNAIEYVFSSMKRIYRNECTAEGIGTDWSLDNYFNCLLGTLMIPIKTDIFFHHVHKLVLKTRLSGGHDVPRYN